MITDVLLNTFQCLELNELEKLMYVSRKWNSIICKFLGNYLSQRRRLHELRISVDIRGDEMVLFSYT